MPQLMKIFTSGDKIGHFEPTEIGDEKVTQQADDYVNYLFLKKNNGYDILNTCFRDALLQKNCFAKVYWCEKENIEKQDYKSLTESQVFKLVSNPKVTVTSQEEVYSENGEVLYNISLKIVDNLKNVVIEALEPENVLVSPDAKSVDKADFIAHRIYKTRSDLINEGFDKDIINSLPVNNSTDNEEELQRGTSDGFNDSSYGSLHKPMDKVEILEAYIRFDYDDDDYAELRKVIIANDKEILYNKEIDEPEIVTGSVIPQSHQFFGKSFSELVEPLQEAKTALLRQMLDNMYQINNVRYAIRGDVNIDDLLNSAVGSPIRMGVDGEIMPQAVQPLGLNSIQALEYFDSIKENRTGVTKYNQGLDADSLNKTASGINRIMNASQERIALVARNLAEGFVKELFQKILKLVCKYQDKAAIIRLRNEFVEIDPIGWNHKMDFSISVGLGTNDKNQEFAYLMQILNMQKEALASLGNGNLTSVDKIYNSLDKICIAAGLKSAEPYFINPKGEEQVQQQQEESPDPRLELEMLKLKQDFELKSKELLLKAKKQSDDKEIAESKLELEGMKIGIDTADKIDQKDYV
jgi:hypothetical protein